ncbi:MAG: ABC transporter permease [Candidatus Paceibacterota bacterium]|jgi:ABC-2 type transport system permease protein
MNKAITIIKKELNSHFNSPLGYVVISVFLVIAGWLFMQTFFLEGQSSMRSFFGLLPVVFMFILPAVTMSEWAEEKRSGTVEVLMTFPVRSSDVVFSKFFSCFAFLAIMLFFSTPIPFMVTSVGSPDRGVILAGYLGALLLGSSYIAIGLWVSSVTKNQIVSFLLGAGIIFTFFIIGNSFILDSLPPFFGSVGRFLSLTTHFNSILRGVISLADIVYYLSIVAFFLFLNTREVSLKKWK